MSQRCLSGCFAWLFVLAVLFLLPCGRIAAAVEADSAEVDKVLSFVTASAGIPETMNGVFADSSSEIWLPGTEAPVEQAYHQARQQPSERSDGKDEFILPISLKFIGDEAFAGTAAQAVYLPETVTVLGNRVFAQNARLQFVSVPESVRIVGSELFAGSDRVVILGVSSGRARDLARANSRPFRAMDAMPRESEQRTDLQRSPQTKGTQEHVLVPLPMPHEIPTGRRACENKPTRRQDRAEMHFLDEYFP